MEQYDFSGWATKNDLRCSDGRIIRKNAFKHQDGQRVPLVWGHQHNDPMRVLGYAILHNRDEGVYANCKFNDTDQGQNAKKLVQHGDVNALSICATQLKQAGGDVLHGSIKELSLVLAGANPGAFIDFVIKHGDESEDEAIIYTGEYLDIEHSDEGEDMDTENTVTEEEVEATTEDLEHADSDDKTVEDIYNAFTEEQKKAVHYMIAMAVDGDDDEDDEEEDNEVKHNVFDQSEEMTGNVLTHEDQVAIMNLAKQSNVGSFKQALSIYLEDNKDTLAHGIEDLETLFPEVKDVHPGAPELLGNDMTWVGKFIKKVHKSPYSRIRTRQADARTTKLRAKGYNNRAEEKKVMDTITLLQRTFDPQTVYIRENIHRDDIIDITDFDYVAYMKRIMRDNFDETLALAALIGDGRDESDPDKIHRKHIRPIWGDDPLYVIHQDVDIAAAKAELQGSETGAHFGENYIYAEAIISAVLYAREKYKGKGSPDFYCDPHLLNVMLLARDLNGRRIYNDASDLARALNVASIETCEQFAGQTRVDGDGKTKKLLAILVNPSDYQFGATKGGEITNFEQFDIDFNLHKYLMETRLSGALVEVQSAIVLEEPVTGTAEETA